MKYIESLHSKPFFRFRFALLYLLSKIKFIHFLFPKELTEMLPIGWNNAMFWLTFKTGGRKVYMDYYTTLKVPSLFQPKVEVEDERYQFSEEDIHTFYKDGYLGPFTLMSQEEAQDLKAHIIDLAQNRPSSIYSWDAGDFELELNNGENSTPESIASNKQVAMMKMNWRDRYLDDFRLQDLFKDPEITERCAQLLGPNLMLWRTQFFPKSTTNCGTPWHQATTYLSDNMRESVLLPKKPEELFQVTIWLALTDVTPETGAMIVVPGSHLGVYPITAGDFDEKNSKKEVDRLGTITVSLEYSIDPDKVKCIEMKAGQFFIFSERLVHGSLANIASETRWAMNGRIVKPDTRIYSKKMLREGHSYRIQNVSLLKLDKWKAMIIRGEDPFGYNRVLTKN